MSSGPAAQASSTVIRFSALQSTVETYLELGKARLSSLVVCTALVGYLLASRGPVDWGGLVWTVLGTSLIVGGANAFNQVIERERDARMKRTCRRPIPSGRLTPRHAVRVAAVSSVSGLAILVACANPLTGVLALIAFVLYVAVYTPLKIRHPLCTLVGAISGAIPPMLGWTAAAGRLELGAWLLFALLFIWQIPHFLALAWMCREEYARVGYVMLPLLDPSGQSTCRLVLVYSLFLLPIGLAVPLAGLAGWVYTIGSIPLGGTLLVLAVRLYRERTASNARRVFLASVIYLPLLLGLMVADRSAFAPLWLGRTETRAVETALAVQTSAVNVRVIEPDGRARVSGQREL